MLHLNSELYTATASVRRIRIIPGDKIQVKIDFKFYLTQETAELLGCKDLVYAGDMARSGVSSMDLDGSIPETLITVFCPSGTVRLRSEVINGASVMFTEDGIEFRFTVNTIGQVAEAILLAGCGPDAVPMHIEPAQMNLDFGDQGEQVSDPREQDGRSNPETKSSRRRKPDATLVPE